MTKLLHPEFNPENSVFVSANAGAGKTSLLAGRVLSLLLHGTPPSKILCLTFTNAAAAEMSHRILKTLGIWVMADEPKLRQEIEKLTGGNPSDELLKRARGLFAEVLESPSGINIQTIHGFSQSLLRRFPLEAGVSPHFAVMDGRSQQEALAEARLRLFNHARLKNANIKTSGGHDETLRQALENLAGKMAETSFNELLYEIVNNKRRFSTIFHKYGGASGVCYKITSIISSAKENNFYEYAGDEAEKLKEIADLLQKSDKKTDLETGNNLANWLSRPEARVQMLDGYIGAFLTATGEPRQRIFTKHLQDEVLKEALLAEQMRVVAFDEYRKTAAVLAHTQDVLTIAAALLAEYDAIKRAHAWMDYDDLIMSACALLMREGISPWVLFKLDGGIDHILVDEAQDTSPEQWQIVDALAGDFFVGQGRSEAARSLFVVGDEKQSIYSFQGANVKELARMQGYFSTKIKEAAMQVHQLSLVKSYRSTDAVLQAVDAIFANPKARKGLTFDDADIAHIPTRSGQAGHVEIWPLIRAETCHPAEGQGLDCLPQSNQIPQQVRDDNQPAPTTLLVRKIADEIAGWIGRGEAVAGEIMILLRTRGTLADRLVRALKRRGVPVAGSDRMRLNDNLAVQDLVALAQILLLPEDDLTLAACLKSPIFNVSEEALFRLAYEREKQSLWQRLAQSTELAEAYELLAELRARADYTPPFELYSYLLNEKCGRANFIGRMGEECADPIDEFLQQTLLYERSHPPSLQGFLHWLSSSNSEIKRDMEQARDAVRIMTVHGAKGLQAKIVILPDTVDLPREQDSLLWFGDIPIRAPDASKQNKICKKLIAERREASMEEYLRLLYVALTRAEDRLYICGATGKEKISEECWYSLVEAGLAGIKDMASSLRGGVADVAIQKEAGLLPAAPSVRSRNDSFSFLATAAPTEPSPSKPLTPSRPSGEVPANASPLAGKQVYAVGKYVHLLLQYLPAQEAVNRPEIAKIIARQFANQIAAATLEKATSDALAVIANPEFDFLFGEQSLAEVPITGIVELDGEKVSVSGQIDRLYIGQKDVWIVDFKSNQLPPENASQIPKPYIRQLALYRLLMQKIEPEKTIRCALLWTANARLDELPEASPKFNFI